MSFLIDNLKVDEKIIIKAKVSKLVYVKAALSFALLMEPLTLLKSVSTELALTNKRVIGRTGIFGRKSILLPHAEVLSVKVIRGALGMLMGCGNVVITSKDGTRTTFKGIKKPLVLEDKINEAVEMAVLGRRLMDFDKPKSVAEPAIEPTPEPPIQNQPLFITPPKAVVAEGSAPAIKVDPNQW